MKTSFGELEVNYTDVQVCNSYENPNEIFEYLFLTICLLQLCALDLVKYHNLIKKREMKRS